MKTSEEFLKEKGINPIEPIYWDLENERVELNELLESFAKERVRNEVLKTLEAYNIWLLQHGYTDTDIIHELDINDFLDTMNS